MAPTQTAPPDAFLMLSKLPPKTFLDRRVHKAEFSLRHSPWQRLPSSRDRRGSALISQHTQVRSKHLLPSRRAKFMAGSRFQTLLTFKSGTGGWRRRASIFLPNMSIRRTRDGKDGRGGRITFQQIQLFSLQESRSVGGFHPCQSLTMLSSFAILFLFVILNYIGEKPIVSAVLK